MLQTAAVAHTADSSRVLSALRRGCGRLGMTRYNGYTTCRNTSVGPPSRLVQDREVVTAYRGGGRWRHGGDAIGRFGHVFRILSGTPQAGSIRRTILLLFLGFSLLIGLLEDYFFFGADNLLAANFHGLYPHHFIPHDAHEVDVGRGLTIDPLFVLSFAVFLPYFLWSLPFGMHHHLCVHADQHMMRLDCFFHLRRHGIEIGLFLVPGIEVQHRV